MQPKTFGLTLLACLMTISVIRSAAQNTDTPVSGSGIYLTEADFLQDNATLFAHDDTHNHLERKLHDVILTRAGKKYTLAGGTFFGYVQHGARYRFYQDNKRTLRDYGYYKVVDDSDRIIYSKVVNNPKTGAHTFFYYSDTLTSPIKKLSPKLTQSLLTQLSSAVPGSINN